MIRSIKKLIRDIYRYARHHPVKVFMLVILPLLTSGVLPKLLAVVGLRLPHGVASALGSSGAGAARGFGGLEGGAGKGLSESVNGLMSLAKMLLELGVVVVGMVLGFGPAVEFEVELTSPRKGQCIHDP